MTNPDPVTQFIADARDCVTRANSWPGVPDPVSLRDSWARGCVDRLATALDMLEAALRADPHGRVADDGPYELGMYRQANNTYNAMRRVLEESA